MSSKKIEQGTYQKNSVNGVIVFGRSPQNEAFKVCVRVLDDALGCNNFMACSLSIPGLTLFGFQGPEEWLPEF